MEYQEARALAQRINDRIPQNHPCCKGNGECCKQKDIALSPGDIKLINQAFKSGQIPRSVEDRAIRNAADRFREYCPYFDEENRSCMIYSVRPLACMIYPAGGVPKKGAVISEGPTLAISEMKTVNVCDGCSDKLDSTTLIPVADIFDSKRVLDYLDTVGSEEGYITNNDFALSRLENKNC